MKTAITMMILMVLSLTIHTHAQPINMDAKVLGVQTTTDGSASIRIQNLGNFNPPSSTFTCSDSYVTVGGSNDAAKNRMLANIYIAYTNGITVRIGINDCVLTSLVF